MPSTLGFAILGLLARQPQTGYDIARRMRAPIGYFWQSTHSQIYPELHRLEVAGLVSHEVVDGPGPRDTKRYNATEVGIAELRAWATSPAPDQPDRDEFVLRVYSLWVASPTEAAESVRRHRVTHATRLQNYCDQEHGIIASDGPGVTDLGSPEFASLATLRAGIGYETHILDWCDWLLGRLTLSEPDL